MDMCLEKPLSEELRAMEGLLAFAHGARATDLHLEPRPGGGWIRLRVDGFFKELGAVDQPGFDRMVGRIRVLAHLPSYESFKPQEGRINPEESGIPAEIRVSILPTVAGEKAVLRFLRLDSRVTTLEELGLGAADLLRFQEVARWRSGMILICGPSGSGKTTTLYALIHHLMEIHRRDWQFVSVEDPVERRIEGMTQVEVKPQYDLGFPSALKYLLRQDPEVIMVGEIRDADTASVAVQSAYTGHLVLSTMHVGFAHEAVLRFQKMGIKAYQLQSALRLVFTQRLLRKKCGACRSGCDACDQTGYLGLVPVGEFYEPSESVPAADAAQTKSALRMEEAARRLEKEGITTDEEIHRVLE
jgi:general secretion pathway protein E